ANPRFKPFLDKVTEKGFFKGCDEGSDEYLTRMQKLIDKFRAKVSQEAETAAPAPATAPS
ncbi:unnamed protein product, partial [Heterosigma akashiwo]